MTTDKKNPACSSVPLDPLVGLESASMDIADRLHGYAMLHKGMTPESWAMAEGRDEIIGLRQIVAVQRDLIVALERVADISIRLRSALLAADKAIQEASADMVGHCGGDPEQLAEPLRRTADARIAIRDALAAPNGKLQPRTEAGESLPE